MDNNQDNNQDNSQETASASTGVPQNMMSMEEANAKKAKTSLIMGIVLCVLNLGMICSTLLGGGFLYGGLFIIIAIVGIQNGVQGKNSPQKGMAVAGMVLNIIALVVAVLFVLLGIVLKFMN